MLPHPILAFAAALALLFSAPATSLGPPARLAAVPDDPIAVARHAIALAEDLRAADPGVLGLGRAALDLASVAARDDALASEIVEAAMPVLELQGASARTLADARWVAASLRTLEATPSPASTDEALALAQALVSVEPVPTALALPPPVRFSSLAPALEALFEAYPHAPLGPAERAGLDAVLATPPDVQRALTRLIAAELRATAFARTALAAEEYEALALVRPDVVAAVREALPALRPVASAQSGSDKTLLVCGVIGLDLAGVATEWPAGCDVPLLVDVGGDDVYRNNAGGALAPTEGVPGIGGIPAAIALDLEGDDIYSCGGYLVSTPVHPPVAYPFHPGCAGGANVGAGHLFEFEGDDHYASTFSVIGSMGAGFSGSGFLFEGGGNDVYQPGRGPGNGGGAVAAVGTLLDIGGNDAYTPFDSGDWGCCLNGAANTARGTLIDLGGDDLYTCTNANSCNGAAAGGAALLVDQGRGDDAFLAHARNYGNAGVMGAGIGALVDDGGDNRFASWAGAGNAGFSLNPVSGVKLTNGLSILMAGSGNDTYETHGGLRSYNPQPMVGLGAALNRGVALLVDEGGTNSYLGRGVPGQRPLLQGAGAEDGVGLLVDRGTRASFTIEDGVAGQGVGIRGVGMIFQTRGDTVTSYEALRGAFPSATGGGGLGFRLNRGAFELLGTPPLIRCPAWTYEFAGFDNATVANRSVVSAHVCSPDASEREALSNPLTAQPVGPVPKPPVPCRSVSYCEDVVGGALGRGPVDWVERDEVHSTTSGGLTYLSGSNSLLARAVMASFDDVCQVTCASTGALDTGG